MESRKRSKYIWKTIYGKDNISYCYGKDGLFLQKMLGQMAIGSGKK